MKFLLWQKPRPTFLDFPWLKIMLSMVKIQLQKFYVKWTSGPCIYFMEFSIVVDLTKIFQLKFKICVYWGIDIFCFWYLCTKDSFLRALREVAPETELFLENHGQHNKIFVIELIYIQICTFRHFTKKLYLARYVCKYIPPHLFAETLSQTLLYICGF